MPHPLFDFAIATFLAFVAPLFAAMAYQTIVCAKAEARHKDAQTAGEIWWLEQKKKEKAAEAAKQ